MNVKDKLLSQLDNPLLFITKEKSLLSDGPQELLKSM